MPRWNSASAASDGGRSAPKRATTRGTASPLAVRPINALTSEEREAIREAVACAEWADLSCRELSIKILETQERYLSHVAMWEYERAQGLAGHRGKRRLMGRHRGAAPDT